MPTLLEEKPALTEGALAPFPELLESPSHPFRFCFNTSTVRKHALPLPELCRLAAAAGYDAIEPWMSELERFVAEGGNLSELRSELLDIGLTVESAIGFFDWINDDDEKRDAGLVQAHHDMELLARLGGRRIAAPPFGVHTPGSEKIELLAAADRYRTLCELGDETGIVPMVEVWGFSANLNRLGEAALIAIESGHPNASILCDVYHLYKGRSPVEGLMLLSGNRLPVFHVNDYPELSPDLITDADRVYPGDGVAPLRRILRNLDYSGFRGYLSLELFNESYYQNDPLIVAKTGLEKLKRVVEDSL
ncbi:sugar phosphate isomerase/epimerase family protein [Armatimonas sp.]|uniref:sugar phosphate isomerase/epimerase family protein n=1 Tax=Armatimonas sp. TaxID=1872638 RepID=UPI00286AE5F6|nr:sugar phosphate isomerase/epimerase family protein [Armatimonas sp.]